MLDSGVPDVGVQLSVGGATVEEILAAAVGFEAAGLESVWVGSHLIDFYDAERNVPECLTTLAAVASVTSTIRLGSLALPAVQLHPSVLAQMVGTLAELSGGRFEIGVGAGGTRGEFDALGIPFPRRRDRVTTLERTLRILNVLRDGGPVYLAEAGVTLTNARCLPTVGTTPIVVAALGTWTARLAGRFGDELNTMDSRTTFDAERVIATARREASLQGRDVRVSLLLPSPAEPLGGGPHPDAGMRRAEALGAHRVICRLVPPYPDAERVLNAVADGYGVDSQRSTRAIR